MRPLTGVVLPVRAFTLGKARLAGGLADAERTDLARRMAGAVRRAAGHRPVVVVSSAPEVVSWAAEVGADVLDDPGDLDAAAARGVAHWAARGAARVLVVHADLPRATTLDALARDAGRPVVACAPCHRDDGTNVLAVPATAGFRFSYGPGSFRRHLAEARRLGMGTRVVRDPDLAFDVDVPGDLAALAAPAPGAVARTGR